MRLGQGHRRSPPRLCLPPVTVSEMAESSPAFAAGAAATDVSFEAQAAPMVAALRSLSWPVRQTVLDALKAADTGLWVRCMVSLGPDEILWSGVVIEEVGDFAGAIPLPDKPRGLAQASLHRYFRMKPRVLQRETKLRRRMTGKRNPFGRGVAGRCSGGSSL